MLRAVSVLSPQLGTAQVVCETLGGDVWRQSSPSKGDGRAKALR